MTKHRHGLSLLAITAILSAAIAPAADADDVVVTATVSPPVVSLGSDAVLTVTVQGKFRRTAAPQLPDLDDFYIHESGTSQNFSLVNGQMSSSITYTYALSPQKEGTFTIAPITFTIEDKEYTADPVTLEVTAASSSVSPPQRQAPTRDADRGGQLPNEDQSIFITATTDRDTVYVNQQITWTLGYYSDGRVGLLRSPNYTPPAAEGFWVEDLPPQNKYYTTLHDRRYLVNEIKRAYFPAAPGVHTIGEARVEVVIDDMSRRDWVDDFFSRSLRSRGFGDAKTLLTEAREIVVLPLPAQGRPPGFTGTVAEKLLVSIQADKQVVQVGEPINVSLEINGVGNIKTVAPPPLPETDKYKVYESGSKSDTFKKDYVVSGRKQYDFVLIPQVEGKWSIPAVELAYFDPVDKRYRVARSHAIPLDVQPGAKEEGRKVIYAGGGDDIEVISRDIRYIHPVPSSLAIARRPLYRNGLYLGLHALPLLAVVVSLFVERRRRRLRDDVVFARSSRALREATRRLSLGEKLFASGDIPGGYSALAGALSGYFADKMNAAHAGLTAGAIVEFLQSRGCDEDTIAKVQSALSESDAARFAAAGASAQRGREAVAAARETLRAIEKRYLS